MPVFVRASRRAKAYTRKNAMSRGQRLSSIYDRLDARQSNSGMHGLMIIDKRKKKILNAIGVEFRKPENVAKRIATRVQFTHKGSPRPKITEIMVNGVKYPKGYRKRK